MYACNEICRAWTHYQCQAVDVAMILGFVILGFKLESMGSAQGL